VYVSALFCGPILYIRKHIDSLTESETEICKAVTKEIRRGFEVFTAMVMESSIFWDITSCGLLKSSDISGGKCSLHLQGLRESQAINR
jgi:hypothetical protein